jgi:hypothetical protein
MIAFDVSETIQRPADAVFAHLTEPDVSVWEPNVVDQRVTSNGPFGVGSTGINVRQVAGLTVETTWIVTEYAPPLRFRLESVSGPVSYAVTYECEALDAATRCTIHFSADPHGFFAIEEPLLSDTIKRDFAGDLARLRSHLEQL